MKKLNNDKDTVESLKHYLDYHAQLLLDSMVENNIIKKAKDSLRPDEQAYSMNYDQPDVTSIDNVLSINKDIILSLNLFKETITSVGYALNIKDEKISNIILRLRENGAFINTLSDQIETIIKFVDTNEQILPSQDILQEILNTIEHDKINFPQLINDILQYYTNEKAKLIFAKNSFEKQIDSNKLDSISFDIIGYGNSTYSDILFGVKYRRKNISSFNNFLYQYAASFKKYDKITNKENLLFIIVYTFETVEKFEGIKLKFNKSVEDLFPEFIGRLMFLPINIKSLHEFDKLIEDYYSLYINKKRPVEILFKDIPILIKENEQHNATSAFIQSSLGSFATWVKVPSKSYFLKEPMNNKYIIGHDTQKGIAKIENRVHLHANAWGFSLSPNKFNTENQGPPTAVHWRLWLSNKNFENITLDFPEWEETEINWHHFFVRWDHSKPLIELFQNGKLITSSTTYLKHWPNSYNDYVSVGNWLNYHKFHYLNMELFRTVLSQNHLSDIWMKDEVNRYRPK